MNVASRPEGRPTDYKPEYCAQAFSLALLGCTDEEMASVFDVSESTLHLWKQKHPKFSESIKDGKEKADSQVAKKLHERALGYEWMEETPIKVKEKYYDEKGKLCERERVEIVMVRKIVPPDPTSALFWLKNRKTSQWRDKREVDLTSGGEKIGLGAMSDEEIALMSAEFQNGRNKEATGGGDGTS